MGQSAVPQAPLRNVDARVPSQTCTSRICIRTRSVDSKLNSEEHGSACSTDVRGPRRGGGRDRRADSESGTFCTSGTPRSTLRMSSHVVFAMTLPEGYYYSHLEAFRLRGKAGSREVGGLPRAIRLGKDRPLHYVTWLGVGLPLMQLGG